MTPDPRWLAILKASGWQTGALAVACGIFWLLVARKIVPAPAPIVMTGTAFGGLICGCLSAASILSAIVRVVRNTSAALIHTIKVRKSIERYLPHLSQDDIDIISHLLHFNQKTFTIPIDGGFATTLIARGFIVVSPRPGQTICNG